MEIQSNIPSKPSNLPADDFFEDFDFKPLSDGLGFHHGNKQQDAVREATRVVKERATHHKVVNPIKSSHPFEQHLLHQTKVEEKRDFVQNDLALFYAQVKPTEVHIEEVVNRIQLAPNALRLSAFVIDFILVSGLTYLTLGLVSYISSLDFWTSFLSLDPLALLSVVIVFSSYFLMYFTLLEKFQGKSIGKDIMGISLDLSSNSQMMNVFLRSFITLVGFLSFGLTSLVGLPGAVTNTRVIKK